MKSQVIKKQFYTQTICDTDASRQQCRSIFTVQRENTHTAFCVPNETSLLAKEFNNSCATKV